MPSLKPSIGDPSHISLDDACELITVVTETDELGQPVKTREDSRQVFCARLSVSRAEYFEAGQNGLKPALMLVVDSDEYDGQEKIKYDKNFYHVYRDFMRGDGFTELYAEVRSGG